MKKLDRTVKYQNSTIFWTVAGLAIKTEFQKFYRTVVGSNLAYHKVSLIRSFGCYFLSKLLNIHVCKLDVNEINV